MIITRRGGCIRELPSDLPNEFGLERPSADDRKSILWSAWRRLGPEDAACADRERLCVGGGRRLARFQSRLAEGRFHFIGGKAFGRWSACADRENPFASAKADARRASA
jgi:hypothetical protein